MKSFILLAFASSIIWLGTLEVFAQDSPKVINDSNTPLHLLTPQYQTPYKELTRESIQPYLDRILVFLDSSTPTKIIHGKTREVLAENGALTPEHQLERGAFRLTSYEWGVTYSGMMEVARSTGEGNYMRYVSDRLTFLARVAPVFDCLIKEQESSGNLNGMDGQMRQVLRPHALDDAGAVCAAMIKYQIEHPKVDLRGLIDNYIDFIMHREYRLADGTFARKRPQMNALWLDDMYMAIPAIVQMGKLTGENRYFDEAVKQVMQFSERMFVKEKGLYMHGWIEGVKYHPAFHWGRANGWAILTLTEVLDVLPENYPGRDQIMALYKAHLQGIVRLQSGKGLWHQLLDRNDSYLETSATAIFTYCIARGINNGWIDAISYGPVAHLGWNAVTTKITEEGHVQDVCVGTGMAFDPAYYYYRPVNVYAAHGYGPVLLAGAEMIRLVEKFYPKMNDSAIQYYSTPSPTNAAIFGVDGTTF